MKKTYSVLFFSGVVIFFLWSFYSLGCKDVNLKIYYLDVGQGDSTYIRFPDGTDFLIDTGPYSLVNKPLSNIMKILDNSIDSIFVTHFDSDHHGGLITLAKNYSINNILLGEVFEERDSLFAEFGHIKNNINVKSIKSGSRIYIGDGEDIYFDVLSPESGEDYQDINDQSLILRLVYKNNSFLFTGDASGIIEKRLEDSYGEKIKSDVLKLGHHGSKTSTSKDFLELVSPQVAVISAGKDNSYGHPSPEVIDLLKSKNIEYFETKDGSVLIESDGESIFVNRKHSALAECFLR